MIPLQWRHNERDGVSNHQPHDCLLNRVFRRRSKKTPKILFTSLWVGNSPVTGEFPTQKATNAENVSIWWHHHVTSNYWLNQPKSKWNQKPNTFHEMAWHHFWIYSISHLINTPICCALVSLQWRHNGGDSVSNHQPHDCLLNRWFRRRLKKTSKLRLTGLCVGNSPGTDEFPAQMTSYAENVFIWWRHHVCLFFMASSWVLGHIVSIIVSAQWDKPKNIGKIYCHGPQWGEPTCNRWVFPHKDPVM